MSNGAASEAAQRFSSDLALPNREASEAVRDVAVVDAAASEPLCLWRWVFELQNVNAPAKHKSVYATASVVKLVDTRDLGSRAEKRGGSSPSARTEGAQISGPVLRGR